MTLDADPSAGYFEVLQLPPGSSAEQIHAQYRALAKQYHPDRNPHRREWSEAHLRRLNEAYHALAEPRVLPIPVPVPASPASNPQPSGRASVSAVRPRLGRRLLRYGALVGGVCALSIAYANWPQAPQIVSASETGATLAPPPPAVPAKPAAATDQAKLAAQFSAQNKGVDSSAAQASQLVSQVNSELQHAPQSRRPQKAEQLAADVLELKRLQHSVQVGLTQLRTPTSQDLHRTQVADLQLALFQLSRQRHLVNAETAAFPGQ